MTLKLYLHPFSSYCQKAITAFYEKDIAFEARILDGTEPVASEFNAVWPFGKFPVLTHNGKLVFEATGIIEYLDATHPHTRQLIPSDPLVSADVRMWDRFFDNYINYPQQRLVYIALGREHDDGGNRWRAAFDTAYAFLDRHMEGRKWVSGMISALPTALRRLPCSTQTGPMPFPKNSPMCGPIANVCLHGRAMPAHSMKRDHSVICFR